MFLKTAKNLCTWPLLNYKQNTTCPFLQANFKRFDPPEAYYITCMRYCTILYTLFKTRIWPFSTAVWLKLGRVCTVQCAPPPAPSVKISSFGLTFYALDAHAPCNSPFSSCIPRSERSSKARESTRTEFEWMALLTTSIAEQPQIGQPVR